MNRNPIYVYIISPVLKTSTVKMQFGSASGITSSSILINPDIKGFELQSVYFPRPLKTLMKLFIFHLDFVHVSVSMSSSYYIIVLPPHL